MLRAEGRARAAEGVDPRRTRGSATSTRARGARPAATAPLANWANAFRPPASLLEKTLGIHRDRNLPRSTTRPSRRWFRGAAARPRPPSAAAHDRVALFVTCSVNYNEPRSGATRSPCSRRTAARSPARAGLLRHAVSRRRRHRGARGNARRNIAALLPLVERGLDVVVPQPTCSYVLKKEYPLLAPGPEAEAVAARTRDLFEYLGRHAAGHARHAISRPLARARSPTRCPATCASQNMGFKTRDVLQLIPGTEVVDRSSAARPWTGPGA